MRRQRPRPTTDRCVTVNDVDWVIKEGDPVWTLTTYGREPATEILMDPNKISSATVLADLAPAAAKIKAVRKCVGQPELLQNLPTSTPASSRLSPGRSSAPAGYQRRPVLRLSAR
ncbi:hypothetical protein AHiyo8_58170 [Arthrobacter sp. Hiyo8]|nr:hypothetical protein AHiyo8_58170 [Arthrobacter sp. Hiyo8]